MVHGSCCCGGVTFTISGNPSVMGTCHCSRCRKLGIPTFVFVKRDQFTLVSGEHLVQVFRAESPYKYDRSFCRQCGTALGEPLGGADAFPINAHCIDNDPGVRNRFHEFVEEKPGWYEICDDAEQFPRHPDFGGEGSA